MGILLATATASLLIVPFISTIGWRSTLALLGVAGMGLSIPLVWFFVQDEPRLDSGVSEAELAHIHSKQKMSDEALKTTKTFITCAIADLGWRHSVTV